MPIRPLAGACAALLLAACATAPRETTAPATPAVAPAAEATFAPVPKSVPEAWESAKTPAEELDSLATWTTPDGGTWLIASAKSTHRLVVYDAQDGRELRTVGEKGDGPGQFN